MTEGYKTEAEGYAASLRQQAAWIEESPAADMIDADELREAAAFIERISVAATPASLTDEVIDAYLKSTGDWCEPHEAERECGVPIECDISQDDADSINTQLRDGIRSTYGELTALAMVSRPHRGGER
jgi:hypothetical protein